MTDFLFWIYVAATIDTVVLAQIFLLADLLILPLISILSDSSDFKVAFPLRFLLYKFDHVPSDINYA